MILRALQMADAIDLRKWMHAGSFCLEARKAADQFEFVYVCPCGCGVISGLLVGEGNKPGGERPSWSWNGSRTEPTLQPSVNQVDHWHGWLNNGYWESC